MNVTYEGPADLPEIIPVFPLPGALLLPRGQMPLNIFEPRYIALVDAALSGPRLIGMVQPQPDTPGLDSGPALYEVGCVGRMVQFAETGDGRYLLSLTGVSRFGIIEEITAQTPFRRCRVTYDAFAADFRPRTGEAGVDRAGILDALRRFTDATGLAMNWEGIEQTANEALVNALAMLAPFGPREKQALLEAADLKARAEMLIALTEIELAKSRNGGGVQNTTLQ